MNSSFTVTQVVNSVYSSNSYILAHPMSDGVEVWIIDMGDVLKIEELLPSNVIIKGVVFTHTHYDHIYGVNDFLALHPNARLLTNVIGKQAFCSPKFNYSRYHLGAVAIICSKPENIDIIEDGAIISLFDGIVMNVIATPGHDASCLTYLIEDYVFSGDSFIPGISTRTTFLLSDKAKVEDSEKIIIKISTLKTLCPGHGPVFFDYNNN